MNNYNQQESDYCPALNPYNQIHENWKKSPESFDINLNKRGNMHSEHGWSSEDVQLCISFFLN